MAPERRRVLCISYDGELLHARQMLEQAGFDVTSATGFAEALVLCEENPKFDLIVMGQLIAREEKAALISTLRPKRDAPVLSIHKNNDLPLPEADFSVDSYDGPEAIISAARSAMTTNT